MEITFENPLIIGNLTVFPDRFKYNNIKCNFCDIKHIGWLRKKLSQWGLINYDDCYMNLFIKGYEEPLKIYDGTLTFLWFEKTPKLVDAYQYISKKTFERRLSFYTTQLEKEGYFIYEDCKFYPDGTINKNGEKYHVKNINLDYFDPFKIILKDEGIFKKKINFTIDIDVILYLIDFLKKNQFDLPNVIKDIIYILISIAKNKYKISSKSEITNRTKRIRELVITAFSIKNIYLEQLDKIIQIALISDINYQSLIEKFFWENNNDKELLSIIVDLIFFVLYDDKNLLSSDDVNFIIFIEQKFKVKGKAFQEYLNFYRKTNNQEFEFLKILEIKIEDLSSINPAEIKKQYIRLVKKYHPDNFSSEIEKKRAEEKMKIINEAYNYFKKKYNL